MKLCGGEVKGVGGSCGSLKKIYPFTFFFFFIGLGCYIMGLSERTLLKAMLLIGILNAIIYLPRIGINLSMPRRKSRSARMMSGNVKI